jgi:hypothetical protein
MIFLAGDAAKIITLARASVDMRAGRALALSCARDGRGADERMNRLSSSLYGYYYYYGRNLARRGRAVWGCGRALVT